MLTGYARVSIDDQDLTLQRAMKESGCKRTFEKASGAKRDQPELARMLEQFRDGSVVVVTRLDRRPHGADRERSLIGERASSGRNAVRDRGVRFGRPSALTPEQVALGRRLVAEGNTVRHVARIILLILLRHERWVRKALVPLTPDADVGCVDAHRPAVGLAERAQPALDQWPVTFTAASAASSPQRSTRSASAGVSASA